jgi:hypothetical protein
MPLTLSEEERNALEVAQARRPKVRHWRRYQAVLLRATGVPVAEVARDLGCSEASVSTWRVAWQTEGLAGIAEGRHRGGPAARSGSGGGAGRPGGGGRPAGARLRRSQLDRAVAADRAGQARRAAERTLRRSVRRLGWRWKRPK